MENQRPREELTATTASWHTRCPPGRNLVPKLLLICLLYIAGCQVRDTTTPPLPAYDLALANAQLVDAADGLRSDRHLLLLDGTIVANLPATTALPQDERVIDAAGGYVIPGLWDMHVHVTYEPELTPTFGNLLLDYGITSVRDTGALLRNILPVVEAWQTSEEPRPRLYWSGPLLDGRNVVYDGNDRPEIGVPNPTTATAEERVATLKAAGASFIKIYELVEPEIFEALVRAARTHQLPIAAHVPLAVDARVAGPELNSLEHLRNMELGCSEVAQELLAERTQLLLENQTLSGYKLRSTIHREQRPRALASLAPSSANCQAVMNALAATVQVPTLRLNTLTRYRALDRDDWQAALGGLPPALAERWLSTAQYFATQSNPQGRALADWSLELTSLLEERGATLAAGTDTPIAQSIPGYALHTELERLVDAGLTPQQALAAATLAPGRFFGWDESNGTLREGQQADLLLLEANPLVDIRNTRRLRKVILDGKVVRDYD